MAFKFSTGLKNALLDTSSLQTLLDDGYLLIYSGAVPASPDDALGAAVELVEYSAAGATPRGVGNGLDLAIAGAVNGTISKESGQTWQGQCGANGTASFFRYVQLADDGTASTSQVRIQGTVGSNADLFVTNTTFASGTDYTIDMFSVSIPDL